MVFSQKDILEDNMHIFSVKDLDRLIDENLKENKQSNKLLIGYKLFHELMNDSKFYTEVTESALSSTKREYKGLKLKITTDEYQLHFE